MSNYAKYKDLGGSTDSFNMPQPTQQPLQGVGNTPTPPSQNAPQSRVVNIQSLDHKKQLILENKVLVVKVYADWCGPCKMIAPRYGQLSNKFFGGACLANEDSELGISNVKGVPTFQFFKNGKYMNQDIVGADINAVEKRIMELLAPEAQAPPQQFQPQGGPPRF